MRIIRISAIVGVSILVLFAILLIWLLPGHVGSGPSRVRKTVCELEQGKCSFIYSNILKFNRNLTLDIDGIFAAYNSNDQDIQKFVLSFTGPAEEVLSDKYGIIFSKKPNITPNSREHSFLFSTEWSDWKSEKTSTEGKSPFLNLLRERGESQHCRWHMMFEKFLISFNTYEKEKLHITANIKLELQKQKGEQTDSWEGVALSQDAVEKLSESIKTDLQNRYRKYLKVQYHIDFSSERAENE